jgi:cytidylate kinase
MELQKKLKEFNKLILKLHNTKRIKQEIKKMIITIAGDLGSGKSTIKKLLAAKLSYEHISIGDLFREMGAKRGLTIQGMNKIIIKNAKMDREMDNTIMHFAREKKDIVADGHVLWNFLPESTKIFLKVDIDEAARRVFEEKRITEKENKTLEDTKENLIKRALYEEKRYKQVYDIEYKNLDNFDIVIDTTKLSPEQIVNKILKKIK